MLTAKQNNTNYNEIFSGLVQTEPYNIYNLALTDKYSRTIAFKEYELKDHLGNVTAVLSDYKTPKDITNLASGYSIATTSYTNYYPFGMMQPGRNTNPTNYRFGFNGVEKDDEIKGVGNSLSFEYRIHDPRIGRFLSIDPLFASYPWNSPYAFAENRCIDGIDLEGLEFKHFTAKQIGGSLGSLNNRYLNQGDAGMCAAMAIAGLWMKNDPIGFKKSVYDLWLKGTTTYNGYTLSPNSNLQNTKLNTTTSPFKGDDAYNYSVDYIIGSSIQNDGNWVYSYKGTIGNDDPTAGLNTIQIKSLMRNLLGYDIVGSERPDYDLKKNDPESVFNEIEFKKSNGYEIILNCDAGMIESDQSGQHSVIYNGNFSIATKNNEKYYNFNVISWGKDIPVSINSDKFANGLTNYVFGKKSDLLNNKNYDK